MKNGNFITSQFFRIWSFSEKAAKVTNKYSNMRLLHFKNLLKGEKEEKDGCIADKIFLAVSFWLLVAR